MKKMDSVQIKKLQSQLENFLIEKQNLVKKNSRVVNRCKEIDSLVNALRNDILKCQKQGVTEPSKNLESKIILNRIGLSTLRFFQEEK
jgi:hypothetical protein